MIAFFQAFAELAPVIISIINLFKEAKEKGWVKDGQALQERVQNAKTPEERLDLARLLFEHRAQ